MITSRLPTPEVKSLLRGLNLVVFNNELILDKLSDKISFPAYLKNGEKLNSIQVHVFEAFINWVPLEM